MPGGLGIPPLSTLLKQVLESCGQHHDENRAEEEIWAALDLLRSLLRGVSLRATG